LRGYNESEKPRGVNNYTVDKLSQDLIEFIEHFGGNAILVGHDWGAIISWAVALRKPEIIQKLIIMNGPEPRAFREIINTNYKQVLASW
jgi:pimeloyl-ACP methyl ester carboxylesterase